MSTRSSVDKLPPEVRAWLVQRLKELGFANYDQLCDELNQKLLATGADDEISRAALGRWGKQKKDAQERMLRSIEMAKSMSELADDDADMLGQAVIANAQSQLFELQALADELGDLDPKEKAAKATLITKIAHCAADVARAGNAQKKWNAELKARVKKAQDAAANIGRKGGLSAGNVDLIREAIAGAIA